MDEFALILGLQEDDLNFAENTLLDLIAQYKMLEEGRPHPSAPAFRLDSLLPII